MPLYSDVVQNASVGATAATYDAVGTITTRTDATYLYGFWVTSVLATSTAAEACSGSLKVSSNDLGLGDQTYSVGPYRGGAPSTNIDMTCSVAEFIPLFRRINGKTKIDILFTTNLPDGTGACSVVVGAVYEAGKGGSIPKDVLARWPEMSPIASGAVNQSVAVVAVAGGTAIGDVVIPGWASEIVGVKQFMVPDLITAGEEIGGYVEYTSTMPDFAPQKWPFGFAINASLGTAVGAGASCQHVPAFGAWFPKSRQSETISAKAYLTTAVTTGNPVVSTIYYR